jgi:hypothetical protein
VTGTSGLELWQSDGLTGSDLQVSINADLVNVNSAKQAISPDVVSEVSVRIACGLISANAVSQALDFRCNELLVFGRSCTYVKTR